MTAISDIFTFFKEKYVHFIVMILLFTLADTVLNYKAGGLSSSDTTVILQALTGIASMAILYFAYFYIPQRGRRTRLTSSLRCAPLSFGT